MCYETKPPSSGSSSIWTTWLQTHAKWPAHLIVKSVRILKSHHTWPDASRKAHAKKEERTASNYQARFLWHGTKHHNIENIAKNGFYSGTWHAVHPNYSMTYTNNNQLILSSVLVYTDEWKYGGDTVQVKASDRVIPLAVIEVAQQVEQEESVEEYDNESDYYSSD
ncbi:hypothetical protein HDV00_004663 [Rhizophlyctis rosea]|nr:hypothetical protein HDV00_004663 [Rhizophlyctis rosea]